MASKFIQRLQEEILQFEKSQAGKLAASVDEIRSKGQSVNLDKNLPKYLDEDIFYTLAKAGKNRIIDPSEMLVTGSNFTIEQGLDFLKVVGLAIRLGASANTYVSVVDPQGKDTVLHILYYLWTILPKDIIDIQNIYETTDIDQDGNEIIVRMSDEEASSVLEEKINNTMSLVALLAVAGSEISMPVSNPNILLERRRMKDQNASQVGAFQDAAFVNAGGIERTQDGPEEVLGSCIKDCNLRYTEAPVEEVISSNDNYPDLADQFFETYAYYRKNRLNLADFLPKDEVAKEIIVNLDLSDSIGVIQQTLVTENDDGEQIETVQETPFPPLKSFVEVHAKKSSEAFLKMPNPNNPSFGILTLQDAEIYFLQSIDVYNIPVAISLLRNGHKPKYETIDRIIMRSRNKLQAGLLASSAALNRIIVEMAERGVGIDEEQLRMIGYFSPSTQKELRRLQDIPYWKRTCTVPGNFIRPDVKKLARELNLPPDMNKTALCEEFEKMDKADPKLLESLAHRLQEKRLDAASTSIGDIVEANEGGKSKSRTRSAQAVCVNANLLSRKEFDYADIDLLMVDEGEQTYCFETRDYANLIEPLIPVNPFTGNKLTFETIGEIKGRLESLKRNNLSLDSVGISEAIRQFKAPTSKDKYDEFVKARVEEFFKIGENFGISRDVYILSPEEGGLSNEEMETITQDLLSDQGITFNVDSRQASIRSMAMTILEKVDEIRGMERMRGESEEDFENMKSEQLSILFTNLSDLIGSIPPSSEVVEE